jgi:hypothetical protein
MTTTRPSSITSAVVNDTIIPLCQDEPRVIAPVIRFVRWDEYASYFPNSEPYDHADETVLTIAIPDDIQGQDYIDTLLRARATISHSDETVPLGTGLIAYSYDGGHTWEPLTASELQAIREQLEALYLEMCASYGTD